ncbi:MAG: dihydropteroate synthase [Bacteroidaceae bacterium]|jgi:dihydropteroate synthase|nr:dihydropteroate synthase [Bacteroidaceae bacterium]HAE24138.1 dihydropteroate synthase [Prevotellaceae bacterium]
MKQRPHTINVGGKLLSLSPAVVMGIINITPDSFYAKSKVNDEESLRQRVLQIINDGGKIIDVGAYSSRPGAKNVSQEEEMTRLRHSLKIIQEASCDLPISVDTFRSDVAKMCVEEYGVNIINDISAGQLDNNMFETVARLQVPYVIMHMRGNPQTMQENTQYQDLIADMFLYFSQKINRLQDLGVNDIIIDPGFGFSKTLDQNYKLLQRLEDFREFDLPILIGVSRKSMIYKYLGGEPEDALNGTSIINTIALLKGANILRVHDVKACADAIKIIEKMNDNTTRYD